MSSMQAETGKVVETGAGTARVEVSQSGICAHCELASSCVPTSGGTRVIEVRDPLGVSVNQRVRIELSSAGLIGASALGYLLPLTGLFAGALVGFYSANPATAELWGGVGALGGLAAGLLVSRLAGQNLRRQGKLTPTIVAVLRDEESPDNSSG